MISFISSLEIILVVKPHPEKNTSWITSVCLTICWGKVDGILHPSLTTISSDSKGTLWLVAVYKVA